MKKEESRLNYSIKNSLVISISQIITILLGFILQTVFIRTLGGTFNGIKGLFTNILSVLSFSELGIGSAITFSLYKPLAENDKRKIATIMSFFKKAYELIGIFIGIIGTLLIPFLHYFTHVHISNLYLYYILYLSNTVISYFYTYKRTLLNADQLNYINTVNQITFKLIQTIFQIIVLVLYQNFVLFLIIQLLCTLISNILISIKVDKIYGYINNRKFISKMPKNTLREIATNTFGSVGEKVGTIVVQSTDNMLISYFLNLFIGGIYSNYLLIINSLSSFIGQATGAISSSIGNLAVEAREDKQKQFDTLKRFLFIDNFAIYVLAVCTFAVINPFIDIWVGKRFEFSYITVLLLMINFIINCLRSPITSFVTAYGLYARDGVKAVIEAVINLIFSIIYIKYMHLGVNGVILGTITSNFLCNWYEPYIVIKYGMRIKNKFFKFICLFLGYLIFDSGMMVLIQFFIQKIKIGGIIGILILGSVSMISSLVSFVIVFCWNKDFNFLMKLIKKITCKVLKIN